jgi:hypothetical protein
MPPWLNAPKESRLRGNLDGEVSRGGRSASKSSPPHSWRSPRSPPRGLTERAEERFATGEAANGYSDTYTASTLFLAAALFFAAISERFDYRRARLVLLGLACVGLIAGVAVSVTQPVTLG